MFVIVIGLTLNFLMVIVFPLVEIGDKVALILSPVSKRASSNGVSRVMLLPTFLPIKEE